LSFIRTVCFSNAIQIFFLLKYYWKNLILWIQLSLECRNNVSIKIQIIICRFIIFILFVFFFLSFLFFSVLGIDKTISLCTFEEENWYKPISLLLCYYFGLLFLYSLHCVCAVYGFLFFLFIIWMKNNGKNGKFD
jgi:hypothetical protein